MSLIIVSVLLVFFRFAAGTSFALLAFPVFVTGKGEQHDTYHNSRDSRVLRVQRVYNKPLYR